jgi:hypothetical protein
VPGATGTAAPPSLEFSRSGTGLITTELGRLETLGSVVSGDTPGTARPLRPRLRLRGWSLYGDDGLIGFDFKRAHGRFAVTAGFGTVGGGVTSIATVATGVTVPTGAIDANERGAAAIAFTKRHAIYLAIRQPGRPFGEAIRVSGSEHALALPAVKLDPRGDALVAWTSSGPQPRCRCRSPRHSMLARIRSPKGHLSAIKRLGPTGDASEVAVGFDKGRKALVGWVDNRPSGGVRVAYAPAGGRFRPTETLEPAVVRDHEQIPQSVRVAFTSNGNAEVAWASANSGSIVAGDFSGGSFRGSTALSSPVPNPIIDSLAAGPRGELLVSWTQGGPSAPKVFAAVRSTLVWSSAELVADGAEASRMEVDPITSVPLAVFVTQTGVQYATRAPVVS